MPLEYYVKYISGLEYIKIMHLANIFRRGVENS
jgi:hypothetical protein